MGVIRRGIAKLSIFTMIAATTVCLVLVGIFVRLGDTMPNIMLSPFLPSYVGEMDTAVAEVQYTLEEEEINSAEELRAFVEAKAGKNKNGQVAPKETGALCAENAKNLVKRTE